jgi:hypothetical protein
VVVVPVEEEAEEMLCVRMGCVARSGAIVAPLLPTAREAEELLQLGVPRLGVRRLTVGAEPVEEAAEEMVSVPMACVAPSGVIVVLLLPTALVEEEPLRLAALQVAALRLVVEVVELLILRTTTTIRASHSMKFPARMEPMASLLAGDTRPSIP